MSEDKVVVCDLDGTLADISHRLHLIRRKSRDYTAFHNGAPADKPNEWCIRLLRAVRSMGMEIHIVSARPDRLRAISAQWLNTYFEAPYQLHLVRGPEDEDRQDKDLKVAWAEGFGVDRILFWIDDRQRVVDAIRDLGLTVLQCASWVDWKPRPERVGGTQ